MNGLGKAAGAPVTFNFDGQTYLLGPFGLRDFGVVENHLLRQKRNQRQQMTLDIKESLVSAGIWESEWQEAKAAADKITEIDAQEVFRWLDTRQGIAFTLWVMLEKHCPGKYTLQDVEDKITAMATEHVENLKASRDQAATLDQPNPSHPAPRVVEAGADQIAAS